jgi:hypothetical protein
LIQHTPGAGPTTAKKFSPPRALTPIRFATKEAAMPKVVDAARATIPTNALWRTCPTCDQLAAMPPDALFCDTCSNVPAKGEGSWTR